MANRAVVGGIDLSQTGLGLVAVPEDWGGDWTKIARATFGKSLKQGAPFWEQIERLERLSTAAADWIERHGCTHVFVEGYPMGGGDLFAIDRVAEIGGALKVTLARRQRRLFPAPVAPQTGRSFVCGKLPRLGRGKQKPYVRGLLQSIGCPKDWTPDEVDAFVAANYGMSLVGGYALAAPQVAS